MPTVKIVRLEILSKHERSRYLSSLSESQELFLENLVRNGTTFEIISSAAESLGYFTVHENIIVELFLQTPSHSLVSHLLEVFKKEMNLERWYIKTFDPIFNFVDSDKTVNARNLAYLFRKVDASKRIASSRISANRATALDLEEISFINDGFFESVEEIDEYISRKMLFTYKNPSEELLACGILTRVIESNPHLDIGMMVAPNYRNQGIGTHVVKDLISQCTSLGGVPIAGCEISNLASKRTLESAGFVSEYKIVELDFSHF